MTISIANSRSSLDDARVEGILLECMKSWATKFPQELLAFKKQMAETRWNLHAGRKSTHAMGMSRGGTRLLNGEVPRTLYKIISMRLKSTEWVSDPVIMEKFWGLFQVGRVNASAKVRY